jgi:hypothetical protein
VILYLMRRNLPNPISALLSIIVSILFATMPNSRESPRFTAVASVAFFLLIWSAMPRRGTVLEAALPVRGRDAIAARAIWTFLLLVLPLAIRLIEALAHGRSDPPISLLLDLIAVLAIAVVLPYAIRPGEQSDPPFGLTFVFWLALAAVSAVVIRSLPADVALEALLVTAVVTVRVTWKRIPDVMEIAPREARAVRQRSATNRASSVEQRFLPRAWRPVLRSLFFGTEQSFVSLLLYPALFILGTGGRIQPVLLLYIVLPLEVSRYNTRWLTAFPISNRARLWCVVMPGILLGLTSLALGRIAGPLLFDERPSLSEGAPRDSRDPDGGTRVPLELWRQASIGSDPVVIAPWGEMARADTLTIARAMLYNPYSTGDSSSARFREWQFERATTALYGRPLSREQYDHYAAGRMLPPTVLASMRMRVLNACAFVALLLLLAFVNELLRSLRRGRGGARFYVIQVIAAALFVALIALDSHYSSRGLHTVVQQIVEMFLWRISSVLPESLVATSLLAALPVVAIYALLERQFGRAEVLNRRVRSTRWSRFLARPIQNLGSS